MYFRRKYTVVEPTNTENYSVQELRETLESQGRKEKGPKFVEHQMCVRSLRFHHSSSHYFVARVLKTKKQNGKVQYLAQDHVPK